MTSHVAEVTKEFDSNTAVVEKGICFTEMRMVFMVIR